MIDHLLHREYLLNTVLDYLIAVGIIVTGIIVFMVVHRLLKKRLAISTNAYIQYILKLDSYVAPIVLLFIIYSAYHYLNFSIKAYLILDHAFTVGFVFLIIRLVTAAVKQAIHSYLFTQDETGAKFRQIRGIVLVVNGVLWLIGLIFLFDNLGFNVTAIITGLGVGGIAIALAAQTILGDLFNYFVIFFDRPFELGDFIIVDDKLGTVEHVGIKTTRIKSLHGEQVVFSNSNLTGSRIHNYKKMLERRAVFKIGVVYESTREKLEMIPQLIRKVIEEQRDTRFDRAHFATFGEYSLNFEVVYYVLSPDYNRYAEIQQRINLGIFDEFKRHEIQFALPRYTVFMNHPLHESTEAITPQNARIGTRVI